MTLYIKKIGISKDFRSRMERTASIAPKDGSAQKEIIPRAALGLEMVSLMW